MTICLCTSFNQRLKQLTLTLEMERRHTRVTAYQLHRCFLSKNLFLTIVYHTNAIPFTFVMYNAAHLRFNQVKKLLIEKNCVEQNMVIAHIYLIFAGRKIIALEQRIHGLPSKAVNNVSTRNTVLK